jgi:hypothetical protein
MPTFDEPRLSILRIVAKHDGEWNWYQVGRSAFDILTEHSSMKLSDLVSEGLVEEKPVEGEPLPRVQLTDAGKAILTAATKGLTEGEG